MHQARDGKRKEHFKSTEWIPCALSIERSWVNSRRSVFHWLFPIDYYGAMRESDERESELELQCVV